MKTPAIFIFIYASAVFFGGLLGSFIAGSIPSLIAGVTFGLLLGFNGYRAYKGNIKGMQLALIQALVLGSFFTYRMQSTQKMMPALPMITMSFILALYLMIRLPKQKKV